MHFLESHFLPFGIQVGQGVSLSYDARSKTCRCVFRLVTLNSSDFPTIRHAKEAYRHLIYVQIYGCNINIEWYEEHHATNIHNYFVQICMCIFLHTNIESSVKFVIHVACFLFRFIFPCNKSQPFLHFRTFRSDRHPSNHQAVEFPPDPKVIQHADAAAVLIPKGSKEAETNKNTFPEGTNISLP